MEIARSGDCQIWRLPDLEIAQIWRLRKSGDCQIWKLPDLEIAKSGDCANLEIARSGDCHFEHEWLRNSSNNTKVWPARVILLHLKNVSTSFFLKKKYFMFIIVQHIRDQLSLISCLGACEKGAAKWNAISFCGCPVLVVWTSHTMIHPKHTLGSVPCLSCELYFWQPMHVCKDGMHAPIHVWFQ